MGKHSRCYTLLPPPLLLCQQNMQFPLESGPETIYRECGADLQADARTWTTRIMQSRAEKDSLNHRIAKLVAPDGAPTRTSILHKCAAQIIWRRLQTGQTFAQTFFSSFYYVNMVTAWGCVAYCSLFSLLNCMLYVF